MSVTVKVTGINEAIKALEHYLDKKKRSLLGVVAETSTSVQKTAQSLSPVDLGELRAEITSTIIEKPNKITGDVVSEAPYSAYVEFGSKPHWTSIKNLEGWAKRHGIPAGAVQYSIATKGTRAQPFMAPAAMKQKSKFVKKVIAVMSSP